MKSSITRLLLPLLMMVAASSLYAETVESDISFQIKVYAQSEMDNDGDKFLQIYKIHTLKTGDIAQRLAAKQNHIFSNRARIIMKRDISPAGMVTHLYLRDKGKADVLLTTPLETVFKGQVFKHKGVMSKNTITSNTLSLGTYEMTVFGDEKFSYTGADNMTERSFPSKQFPGQVIWTTIQSFSGTGYYRFLFPGSVAIQPYSTAVIKHNAPRIRPFVP